MFLLHKDIFLKWFYWLHQTKSIQYSHVMTGVLLTVDWRQEESDREMWETRAGDEDNIQEIPGPDKDNAREVGSMHLMLYQHKHV